MRRMLTIAALVLFGAMEAGGSRVYRDIPEKALGDPQTVIFVQREVVSDFQCVSAPGNPPTGLVRFYCDTATGNLKCLTSSGASCLSSGSSSGYATIQNSGSAQTQQLTINATDGIKATNDSVNSATILRHVLPADGEFLREDFTGTVGALLGGFYVGTSNFWTIQNFTGTGAINDVGANSSTYGGISIASGATSGNDSALKGVRNPGNISVSSSPSYNVYFRVSCNSVTTNGYFAVGIQSTSGLVSFSGNVNDAAWFEVTNTGSAGVWRGLTANGTSSTAVIFSPVETADTNYHDLQLTVNTTSVTFIFDGTTVGTSSTTVGRAGNYTPMFEAKTAANNANTLSIGSFVISMKR